jgi:tetratricopeptide (TPR) repeat protein
MALAEQAGPHLVGFDMRAWHRRLRRDEENLRSALRWSIEAGEPEIGLRTASSIWRYWHYWGVMREGRDLLEELLDQPRISAETEIRARGLSALGSLVYWLGDMERADELYEQSLAIYRRLGDESRITQLTEYLSWTDVGRGDYERALKRADEALSRNLAAHDRAGMARMNDWKTAGAFFMGFGVSGEQALAATNEAVEASRELGNAWDMVNYLGELADINRRMGNTDRAAEDFKATAELYYSLGYFSMLPWLKLLARIEINRGNMERAATLAAVAAQAVEALGGELPETMIQVGNPLEDARGALSEEVFEQAAARGRAMDYEEALAFVVEG